LQILTKVTSAPVAKQSIGATSRRSGRSGKSQRSIMYANDEDREKAASVWAERKAEALRIQKEEEKRVFEEKMRKMKFDAYVLQKRFKLNNRMRII